RCPETDLRGADLQQLRSGLRCHCRRHRELRETPGVQPVQFQVRFLSQGKAILTAAETRGLALYKGKAGCADCHPSCPRADGPPPPVPGLTYDNIGLPRNAQSRFLTMPPAINPDGAAFADVGLQQTTHRPDDAGRMKVPTLRNVAITAPYFHN